MNFSYKTRYLFWVLIIIYLGFFLVYVSHLQKTIPSLLTTAEGNIDISNYFSTSSQCHLWSSIYGAFFMLHLYLRIKLPDADLFILPAVAILSGIGLMMMLRLAPDLASVRNGVIQAFWLPILVPPWRTMFLPLHGSEQNISSPLFSVRWLWLAPLFYLTRGCFHGSLEEILLVFTSAFLVFITLFFGTEINRRRLWILGFQTVELVKLLMVFFIAGYLYERGKGIMFRGI